MLLGKAEDRINILIGIRLASYIGSVLDVVPRRQDVVMFNSDI